MVRLVGFRVVISVFMLPLLLVFILVYEKADSFAEQGVDLDNVMINCNVARATCCNLVGNKIVNQLR